MNVGFSVYHGAVGRDSCLGDICKIVLVVSLCGVDNLENI